MTIKWSLVLGVFTSAVSVGFLLYHLHGPYVLKKTEDNKLRGAPGNSSKKLRLMCLMYTLIMSGPAIQ
jgi:hypothetical protein